MSDYEPIPDEEIKEAMEADPLRGAAMLIANQNLAQAREKAEGEREHEPEFRDPGWSIALETPKGVVGLWSNWMGSQFFLAYPLDVERVDDSLIINNLGVQHGVPVKQVMATAVEDDYDGSYKDENKPLEENEAGQTVAYFDRGNRKWADFCGTRYGSGIGRVWVDHTDNYMSSAHFDVLAENGEIQDIYYGHDKSHSIITVPHNFANKYARNGPTNEREAIQAYRDRFIDLFLTIAEKMGGVEAANVKYDTPVLIPEELENLGFEHITWLEGTPDKREGWGNEVVTADRGNERVTIRSGNALVPWVTIRRIDDPEEMSVEYLLSLLVF